jgi:activator of HSP90 ATPase
MVEQATDKQGVGSIWNKGNWHWEERNYNEFAKQWLSENLTTIMTPEAPDSIIEVYEVKSIKAEASVAIRKGK